MAAILTGHEITTVSLRAVRMRKIEDTPKIIPFRPASICLCQYERMAAGLRGMTLKLWRRITINKISVAKVDVTSIPFVVLNAAGPLSAHKTVTRMTMHPL